MKTAIFPSELRIKQIRAEQGCLWREAEAIAEKEAAEEQVYDAVTVDDLRTVLLWLIERTLK